MKRFKVLPKFDPYWDGYRNYNFHMSLFYKVCSILFVKYHFKNDSYFFAYTNAERITPVAYGRSYEDFEPILD